MKRLCILLTLALTIGDANARRPRLEIRANSVKDAQVIDATHLRRSSKDQIEVIVVHQARGAGLLTLHLNRRETAKLGYADWVCLYLAPGRYRLGVTPYWNLGRAAYWEMNADVSRNTRQVYRIFQSAGFTSSGGNAVYEIVLH